MRSSAIFVVGAFILLPLGIGGVTGVPPTATQEGQFYTSAFQTIAGHTVGTICLYLPDREPRAVDGGIDGRR